jgi:type I restriction enzyme S subunit
VQTLGAYLHDIRYGTSEKCGDQSLPQDIPVLRIPNVVNGLVDWSELKYVSLNRQERDRLILMDGDILFVRTNGNPNYIGRCAVFQGDRPAAFASYLIRARLRRDATVTPLFVSDCLSMPSYRSRMIQEAKTTAGNYNINTVGLRGLPIIEPPRERQAVYARAVAGLNKVKRRMDTDSGEASDLFSALSQRAFRGEL